MDELCSFCDKNPIKYNLLTPVKVDVDDNGNIIKVHEERNLPICEQCKIDFDYIRREKINSIEKILETSFKDQRKRIADLVLIPYLANVRRLEENEVVEIIKKWFTLCNYSETKYKKKIRTQYRYVKRNNMIPRVRI